MWFLLRKAKIHYFFLSVSMLFASCIDKFEFPDEPYIDLKDFYVLKDLETGVETGYIVYGFTDGNGDIGLTEGDTLSPYHFEGNFYNNYMMNVYKKQGSDTLKLEYNMRIPPINPDDYEQPLRGELIIEVPVDILKAVLPDNKFQFEAFIYDRALNKSNLVVSPVYQL